MVRPVATDVEHTELLTMARCAAGMLLVGGAMGWVLVLLPGQISPNADHTGAAMAAAATVLGVFVLLRGERWRRRAFDVLCASVSLGLSTQLYVAAGAGRTFGGEVLYLPLVAFAFAFLPLHRVVAQLVLIAAGLVVSFDRLGDPPNVVATRTILVLTFFSLTGAFIAVLRRTVLRLIGELQAQASTDPLTGLANRRAFLDGLHRLLDLAHRTSQPLTLVFADVDHFKRINDEHGHPTGDEVLRHLGRVLRQHTRAHDLVGRLGGEEFAIAVYGADTDATLGLTSRIAEALQDGVPGLDRGITLSFGLAQARLGDRDATVLLARADDALYAAKRTGRNRAVVAPELIG